MKNDNDTLKFMFKDIKERADQLNEWEEGFIANAEEWFLNGRELTNTMDKKLNKIYERVTENG